jgi:hypothetical protein
MKRLLAAAAVSLRFGCHCNLDQAANCLGTERCVFLLLGPALNGGPQGGRKLATMAA